MLWTKESPLRIQRRHMQRAQTQPILRQKEMAFHITQSRINPPGTEPIIVIQEDDAILVGTD